MNKMGVLITSSVDFWDSSKDIKMIMPEIKTIFGS